jgi:predicted nucleic acid-binding protein
LILYLDTSALVKLYVREVESRAVRRLVRRSTATATSRVAYPEARAAFARRQREGDLSPAALARVRRALDRDLTGGRYIVVDLGESLARLAGDLAERHGLRGFDAIHLASAVEMRGMVGEAPVFCCYDERLQAAATAEALPSRDGSSR